MNTFETTDLTATNATACTGGTYNDGNHELTARIDLQKNGDYIVTATLLKPNTGGLTLVSNHVHIFPDPATSSCNGEVIRVREIVFANTDAGNLKQEITIHQHEIQEEEIVTVVIDLNPILPRKPKVCIIRPGGATTPSGLVQSPSL